MPARGKLSEGSGDKRRARMSARTMDGKFPQGPSQVAATFWTHVEQVDVGCWLWRGAVPSAYVIYGNTPAHRVAYWLATGDDPRELAVLHSCDRPTCVRPDHLRKGTLSDNTADKRERGRTRRAYSIPDGDVCEIRRRWASGESIAALALAFGCSAGHVHRLVRGLSRGSSDQVPTWVQRGLRSPGMKLTDEQVREMRARYATQTVTQRQLASEYGVSAGYVSTVLSGVYRAC